jgi:hypothetical protein
MDAATPVHHQRRAARVATLSAHLEPGARPVAPSPASTAAADDPYRVPVIVGVSRKVRHLGRSESFRRR